ncbi:hypothetical protein ACIQC9_03060 [Brevundimonas sp. NPDC092305]|uniref:hypothetical protein n=1 Tax=Brevundimonas sp. NPDC092305 TaxID=3363957 RepID=UPI003813C941
MRPALVLTLLLGLSACATAAPEAPPAESGSPQPVARYDWMLNGDDHTASLVYGVPETDDLRLGLDCQRGSGKLDLTAQVAAGASPEIYLESGGDTERYPAEAFPSEFDDGLILTASAGAKEPVFQRFRRLGWLAVWQGKTREPLVAHPGSEALIERFFAFCG